MKKPNRDCSPALSRHIDRLYYFSLAFGASPLLAGVVVFILWYFTRDEILQFAGLLIILGGLICVLIASIYLAVSLYWESGVKTSSKIMLRRGLLSAAIIISNFPAAYMCTKAALYLTSLYTLTIENRSASTIETLTITAPGVNRKLTHIDPNETRTLKFGFKEGALEFSARQNASQFSGLIDAIDTHLPEMWADHTVLIIKDNSEYEVKRLRTHPYVD
jgi:hypothetical protein